MFKVIRIYRDWQCKIELQGRSETADVATKDTRDRMQKEFYTEWRPGIDIC